MGSKSKKLWLKLYLLGRILLKLKDLLLLSKRYHRYHYSFVSKVKTCCHMLQHLWPILAATWQSSTCCLAVWTVQDAASFFEVDSSTSKSTATCACPAWGVSKNISNMARNGNVIPKVGSWTLNIKTSGFHGKSFLQIRLISVDAEKHVGTHLQHS